jgi:FixJ family two-component response regulator
MREALSFQFETAGYRVVPHPSESFLEDTGSKQFDCIVVDLCLPRMDGLQLLVQITRSLPFVSIVHITGHREMSTGVRAMREGALIACKSQSTIGLCCKQ